MNKAYRKIGERIMRTRLRWWMHWQEFASKHHFNRMHDACSRNVTSAWYDHCYYVFN